MSGSLPHQAVWLLLPLRHAQSPDPPGVQGAALTTRQPLSPAVATGMYKFVVDAAGLLWVGVDRDRTPQHSALVPAGQPVRAAGNLLIAGAGVVHANARSGHYITESPFTPDQERLFIAALTDHVRAAGLTPGQIFGGDQPLARLLPHRRPDH